MVATTTRHARFAPRTLAILAELLLTRRATVARGAETLRIEAAGALNQQDLSDLFDHEEPSVDSDVPTALMLLNRAERRLWEVDRALARVADGTHGYCIVCSTGIPLERLRALPATARCVRCSRRFSHGTRKLVDWDHPSSNKIRSRSPAGSGMSVRGGER